MSDLSRGEGTDAIELEPAAGESSPAAPDRRPRVPEPLPVRLVAVDDVRLPATAGLERELDAFYVDLLGFAREGGPPRPRRPVEPPLGMSPEPGRLTALPPMGLGLRHREELRREEARTAVATVQPAASPTAPADRAGPVYEADNFRLRFEIVEGLVVRESLRPLGIEVPSLAEAEAKLLGAEIEHTRQRGLAPGQESIVLLDPAGNWVELVEMRLVS
jgi:hypothetical protein